METMLKLPAILAERGELTEASEGDSGGPQSLRQWEEPVSRTTPHRPLILEAAGRTRNGKEGEGEGEGEEAGEEVVKAGQETKLRETRSPSLRRLRGVLETSEGQ